ncbi:MAG: MATE family efflux transporter [Lachnospiraceae bacterium]|nr:MATE family efflux transporter [Lachnospiraceae bacterium]
MINHDLTEGNVTKSLLYFAAPMILGNLLQQCYNIADTWVVGKFVGAQALAAVGSSYALMTFLNSLLIGLCMGGGAVFSYYIGKGDRARVKTCAQTAFVMIGVLAAALSIAAQCLMHPILLLLRTPEELYGMTRDYLAIVFLGIIFIFLYNYYAFLLRALGNSVTPLYLLGAASVLNIGLDLYFVRNLGWGLQGAAAATVISQAVSGLGLGICVWRKEPYFRFSLHGFLQEEKPMGEICRYSLMTSMQQSVMNFGILMVQSLVNSFGPAVMAAFAATVKIDTFAYMPAQEFGNAYSIFISQNFGAGKAERVKQGTGKAMAVSAVFCGAVSVLVFAFARFLMLIFVDAGESQIIAIGMQYLRIEGAFYIGIGILFLLYGYFRGVNRPGISLVLTVISLGTRVALAYILAAIPTIGVTGIWWAIPIGWALADVTGFVLMRHDNEDSRKGKRRSKT